VPLVAPAGTSQAPEQQSPLTMQFPPFATQAGNPHSPLTQNPEQHSGFATHCPPFGRHMIVSGSTRSPRGSQRRRVHTPEQHSSPTAHLSPSSAQLDRTQRPGLPAAKEQTPLQQSRCSEHSSFTCRHASKQRWTPAPSGAQGPPSQHCSGNWHPPESGMQMGRAEQPAAQTPSTHAAPSQQVSPFAHEPFAATQDPSTHAPVASQVSAGQQVSPFAHEPLATTQDPSAQAPDSASQARPGQQLAPPLHDSPEAAHAVWSKRVVSLHAVATSVSAIPNRSVQDRVACAMAPLRGWRRGGSHVRHGR
jgi:hypothetical protein